MTRVLFDVRVRTVHYEYNGREENKRVNNRRKKI